MCVVIVNIVCQDGWALLWYQMAVWTNTGMEQISFKVPVCNFLDDPYVEMQYDIPNYAAIL